MLRLLRLVDDKMKISSWPSNACASKDAMASAASLARRLAASSGSSMVRMSVVA